VDCLERLKEQSESLMGTYKRKLTAIDQLKKALLHQAFTGALTEKSVDSRVAEVA
jgi:hypothetical protein